VVFRYRRQGAVVNVTGMTLAERTLIEKVGRHDKAHLPTGASQH
jgi:sulfate permease, SulP family